jgi:hypothetical protein
MKRVFSLVWKLRGHELRQWCFYNVLLGLSPVVLSWVCLAFVAVYKFKEPFLDGSFLIFTATLSATSLGFYAEDARPAVPKTARVILCGLIAALILGSGGFSALVMIKELSSKTLSPSIVIGVSLFILIFSVWFNLNLAAVRLVNVNEELKAELAKDVKKLATDAKGQSQVDGIKV